MRSRSGAVNGLLAACWIAAGQGIVRGAEDQAGTQQAPAVEFGKCRISAPSLHAWRDWQPIVDRPGPDGGSPLRAKVRMRVENTGADGVKLSYRAVILDAKGQAYPGTFRVLPDFSVLPPDVSASFRNLDENQRKAVIARYNVIWDGSLKAGESRDVALITDDGPYLPVGTRLRVEITWTNPKGESVVARTPEAGIERTD